jgi:hypothetical protein
MMKRSLGFFAVVCSILTACASAPTKSSSPSADNAASPAEKAAQAVAQRPDDTAPPVPPDGALYTLHCAVYTGPTHILDAKRAKDMLIRITHSNEWYIIQGAEESDLYYGFYKTFDDRSQVQEYTRAQADRAKVTSLVDENGDAIFPQVAFASINLPDPAAPRQWDLANNPGFWTLQIAVFRNSPERKQAAVDAVREFRARGIEAYYRHGEGTSEVYIGSWPREAVQEQDDAVAESNDPAQPLLVVPGPLPSGVDADKVYDNSGRKVKVVMPKLQIVDEGLKRMTEQFPYYYVNGEVAGRKVEQPDHSVKVVPWPSYLIQVPHENNDSDQQAKTDLDQQPSNTQGESGDSTAVPGLGGLR